ncbi:sensor domain-containing diguanylate cyclase (plasmid) [Paracoccus sp. Arc7-R13]|uniref:diguanylate cyclase n=1 Tax=Paracoccus sp. Arc7-R13 TaxID=2500532 RepID=UPI000FDA41F7|nr:diguanylate cyclase [Paracoccus sp. Arc7-R13]AZY95599.1 sensor domain-containing diguanylate cyclase [Paracoccus sp. Arc7-R13]
MFDVPPLAAAAVMIDAFPVACFATDRSRTIRYANAEASSLFGSVLGQTIGLHIEAVLTPASKIFCNSYVYPLLFADGCCEELALTLVTQTGSRVPVVANARMHGSDFVLWSAMRAEKREKLQGEVLRARNALQGQTRALELLASRDELTGLLNRRAATHSIQTLIAAADEAETDVTVLLLDIDRFKAINDNYGHDAGDNVLRQLGAALQSTVRLHEVVGRYGGEEFILAIAANDELAARSLNQRVHAAAASVSGPGAPVTVSVGLCRRFRSDAPVLQEVVKAADRALYKAKASGRNCSIIEQNGILTSFG